MGPSGQREPRQAWHVVRLSLIIAVFTMPARPVLAQATRIAKTSAPTDISAPLPNVTTTKGTGVTAAFAMGGGNNAGVGATIDPTAGGAAFDNTVPYGNTTGLNRLQVESIGFRLLRAYPNYPVPAGGELSLGQSLRYNVSGPSDKVGPALGPAGFSMIESTALASAANVNAFGEGTIKGLPNANNNKAVDITGGAMANITNNPFVPNGGQGPGFAIGIAKDPITYTLTSPGGPPSTVYETIGDPSNLLSLQASIPGSFATAFYDLGTSQTGLLVAFSIGIDSQTESLSQVDFQVGYLNPILGFATNTRLRELHPLLPHLRFHRSKPVGRHRHPALPGPVAKHESQRDLLVYGRCHRRRCGTRTKQRHLDRARPGRPAVDPSGHPQSGRALPLRAGPT